MKNYTNTPGTRRSKSWRVVLVTKTSNGLLVVRKIKGAEFPSWHEAAMAARRFGLDPRVAVQAVR